MGQSARWHRNAVELRSLAETCHWSKQKYSLVESGSQAVGAVRIVLRASEARNLCGSPVGCRRHNVLDKKGSAVFPIVVTALFAATPLTTKLRQSDLQSIRALEEKVAPLPGPSGMRARPASLRARMAEARVPGVSIAFVEGGRLKWTRSYGVRSAGSLDPVTVSTQFQAASLSKAVAAAAALRLVDRGTLSLDAPVNARLRSWRLPASREFDVNRVTLRRLLSHTAGLTVSGYPGYPRGSRVPTLVQSLSGAPPATTAPVHLFAAPGGETAYSGGGYGILQLLMQDSSRRQFAPLMQSLVLKPAGMMRSSFDQPREQLAAGHDAEGRRIPGGSHIYPELAAAGLWTTASDYGRFLIALQKSWGGGPNALLSTRASRLMMTPVSTEYGMGVTVIERDGRRMILHGGSNEGFQSRFLAFLDGREEGLVIMTNGEGGGALAAAIQRTIAMAYGWPDPSAPPPPRAPDT